MVDNLGTSMQKVVQTLVLRLHERMANKSYSLAQAIDVKAVGHQLFRGTGLTKPRPGYRAVYGGQIVAQSLMAAVKSVSDPDCVLHSFHCYFLSPVQSDSDVLYEVDKSRDGRTFSSRSVKAIQGGKVAFQCLVSFRRGYNTGTPINHTSHPMPDVPGPDSGGDSTYAMMQWDFLAAESYFCHHRKWLEKKAAGQAVEPRLTCWTRGKDGPSGMESQSVHRVALSYLSDLFMASSVRHKFPDFEVGLITSLDHSMWFHAPVQGSKWHLVVNECVHAVGESALNEARIFGEDGTLVATCKQESLIRPKL